MAESPDSQKVEAGVLPAWDVGNLPPPPRGGWRIWIGLLGPGIVLAGSGIGSGEWLFGPAVTAQYGPSLLWLATISIVLQFFANLMMMRYAVYCGEPIIVGGMRTRPGPALWIPCYLLLDIAAIWPYNASNAAIPLVAAIRGRLPSTAEDVELVKLLGYAIFLLAFVPLIFGGTVYRMLERVMTFKLIFVLTYLTLVAVFMVSPSVWGEVAGGFFQFGQVPQRAETIVAGPHFQLTEHEGGATYGIRGTIEHGKPTIAEFSVTRNGATTKYKLGAEYPAELAAKRQAMIDRAVGLALPGRFAIEDRHDGVTLSVQGTIAEDRKWLPERLTVATDAATTNYANLPEVPEPHRKRFEELLYHQGLTHVGLVSYTREHGRLPPQDWAMLAGFAAIAGLGGMANTLFSNYARDKGWGMGKYVGAIPSAIGGRNISLSHTGRVFPLDAENRSRWFGWMRHIRRDQYIWAVVQFIGMALPCMLTLEFIRNATVESNRVAAMTAEGMVDRHPDYRFLFWTLTLFCGFIILAPGQISVNDQIARRWTDILWTTTKWARRFAGTKVKFLYYGILIIFCAWGLLALSLFDPLQILKISTVLQNIALGFSSLHALYITRALVPRELRPSVFMQLGVLACGTFFLGISAIVFVYL
jgi:Mn2+/Fe2+ NRAMP family transporter